MKTPNFFIVGAPKCGTTSLYKYLGTHPNVYLPAADKEPHYFASDFPRFRRARTADDYLRLFRDCRDDQMAVGEASVFYLYSQEALSNLRAFEPRAKLIAMLRNPVDMVYSLHAQLVLTFQETQRDFANAWRLQCDRQNGKQIPATCRAPEFLQYGQVGMLGDQVERLLNVFPREHILFILFEDFVASAEKAYAETISFLNLPHDGRREFPRVNPSKTHRWRWLSKLAFRTPFPLNLVKVAAKKCVGERQYGMGAWMRRTLMRPEKRSQMSPELRRELADHFQADVRKLERLVRRDLSHWPA